MTKAIVITGELRQANKLALLICLGETDLKYTLFDAEKQATEDIVNNLKTIRTPTISIIVKNVSRETDLAELLQISNRRLPLIVACNIDLSEALLKVLTRSKINFDLITIKKVHE